MKSLLSLGVIFFALSFCGLSEKLKGLTGGSNSSNPASSNSSSQSSTSVEKAKPNATQRAIIDGGTEKKWNRQGLSWKLPTGWEKMDVKSQIFNYGSSDNAFLIATISNLPDTVPAEVSMKATYESSLELVKQGKYEKVRWVEIDGMKGVEWWEAMPESKDDSRRHQWIAFRNYQGQNQQLNIMLSTKGTNFEKHRDDFAAIMYSMTTIEPGTLDDEDIDDSNSSPIASSTPNQPTTSSNGTLTTTSAQAAIDRFVSVNGAGRITIKGGVREISSENGAVAELNLEQFIDSKGRNLTGKPATATFSHYTDGRWALTKVYVRIPESYGYVDYQVVIEVR